jgi:hypothetical protein
MGQLNASAMSQLYSPTMKSSLVPRMNLSLFTHSVCVDTATSFRSSGDIA